MNNQVFVPVTDDLIYNHPEQIEGPLIPYNAGMECQNWLSIELNPEEPEIQVVKSTGRTQHSELHLAYSN